MSAVLNETQSNTAAAPAPTPAPTNTADIIASVKANFDNTIDVKEMKFHFKKTTDEKTGLESKRPTVVLQLPVPSLEGIVAILQKGGKGLELLQEAVNNIVADRARDLVDEKEDITQDNFPLAELTWDAISNLPKAERRGGGISKEMWEEFGKDYTAVMPAITGKPTEKIANQVKIYLNKFTQYKSQKDILRLLKDQLSLYLNQAPSAETYVDCVDFLVKKADTLINFDEASLLANL